MVFARAIEAAAQPRIAAPNWVETAVVVRSQAGELGAGVLLHIMRRGAIAVVPFDAHHAFLAIAAYRTFGKGSGHPARLNLGDCFSYALAKAVGEPLLYKGRDFALTDVASALA